MILYKSLKIIDGDIDGPSHWEELIQKINDIVSDLNSCKLDKGSSKQEEAKQKCIEKLLLILALVRIKRYLALSLYRILLDFSIPALLIRQPTKLARITQFISFP